MHLRAVPGLPEIEAGDDLAGLIDGDDGPAGDDVVVVASTVVSKAEGRGRRLATYAPTDRARRIASRLTDHDDEPKDPRFAQAVLDESVELLLEHPFLLAVTPVGHVGVNAGIDRTNLPSDADVLLLPEDPMASARRLHRHLEATPPVVVADTSGRPFRLGQRGVAIGWAGLPATRDWRGTTDRRGRELHVTVEAIVDELAAAANLVAGEAAGGTPVVVVEDWFDPDVEGGDGLFRPDERDFVKQALREWSGDHVADDIEDGPQDQPAQNADGDEK